MEERSESSRVTFTPTEKEAIADWMAENGLAGKGFTTGIRALCAAGIEKNVKASIKVKLNALPRKLEKGEVRKVTK